MLHSNASLGLRRWATVVLAFLFASPLLVSVELEPVHPGPFAVATTNLEATPHDSGPMLDFLNGKTTSERRTQYLTDILVHPEAVPTLRQRPPGDTKLFGAQAGTRIPLVLLIVYPTTDNSRPDYKFPYKETGDAEFSHAATGRQAALPTLRQNIRSSSFLVVITLTDSGTSGT